MPEPSSWADGPILSREKPAFVGAQPPGSWSWPKWIFTSKPPYRPRPLTGLFPDPRRRHVGYGPVGVGRLSCSLWGCRKLLGFPCRGWRQVRKTTRPRPTQSGGAGGKGTCRRLYDPAFRLVGSLPACRVFWKAVMLIIMVDDRPADFFDPQWMFGGRNAHSRLCTDLPDVLEHRGPLGIRSDRSVHRDRTFVAGRASSSVLFASRFTAAQKNRLLGERASLKCTLVFSRSD